MQLREVAAAATEHRTIVATITPTSAFLLLDNQLFQANNEQ